MRRNGQGSGQASEPDSVRHGRPGHGQGTVRLAGLAAAVLCAAVLSLCLGARQLAPGAVLRALLGMGSEAERAAAVESSTDTDLLPCCSDDSGCSGCRRQIAAQDILGIPGAVFGKGRMERANLAEQMGQPDGSCAGNLDLH